MTNKTTRVILNAKGLHENGRFNGAAEYEPVMDVIRELCKQYEFKDHSSFSVTCEYDARRYDSDKEYRDGTEFLLGNITRRIEAAGAKVERYSEEYRNGVLIDRRKVWSKYPTIRIRDHKTEIDVVLELLSEGETLEVNCEYETFYGCSWYDNIMKAVGDKATAQVKGTWHAWGQCAPYVSEIILTPKK